MNNMSQAKAQQAQVQYEKHLYLVKDNRVIPATEYEKEHWTAWDEFKANSPGYAAGMVLFFIIMAFAWKAAEKLGFYGLWGPMILLTTAWLMFAWHEWGRSQDNL